MGFRGIGFRGFGGFWGFGGFRVWGGMGFRVYLALKNLPFLGFLFMNSC